MEIGDFAVVTNYSVEGYRIGRSGIIRPKPEFYRERRDVGELGRIKDATYIQKLSSDKVISAIDLLLVSRSQMETITNLYVLKLKPGQYEPVRNDLNQIRAFYNNLKNSEGRIEGLNSDDEINSALKQALKDYKVLLNANLKAEYPEAVHWTQSKESIEKLIKIFETQPGMQQPPRTHFPRHPHVYNDPINTRVYD